MPVASTNRVSGAGAGGPSGASSGEEAPDRGAMRSGHVGVDAEAVADRLDRDRRIVVDHERPADQGHACRAGMGDVEAAVGQRPVVAGPDDQVPAALAAIRAGQADVGDPAEPHVVDRAEDARRRPIAGTSITIGPSDRSTNPQK